MPSFAGLAGPAAAFNGLRQSLAVARGANPRTVPASGSFDQHLDLAVRSGIGSGSAGSELSAAQTSDDPSSIEAVRAENQTAMAEFEERFRRLLHEHGIELGGGIVLAANQQGQVTVQGEHPQKAAIEQLLRDEPELQAQFLKIAQQASLLRGADVAGQLGRFEDDASGEGARQVQQILQSAAQGKFSLTIRPADMVAEFK